MSTEFLTENFIATVQNANVVIPLLHLPKKIYPHYKKAARINIRAAIFHSIQKKLFLMWCAS